MLQMFLLFDTFQENVTAENDEKEESKSSIKGMPVDDVSNLVRKKFKRPAEDETQRKGKRIKDDFYP